MRAIGRCAIKVEQSAERCVSTLLDLIQTKVNYVVQEAVVVIKVSARTNCLLIFKRDCYFVLFKILHRYAAPLRTIITFVLGYIS